MGRLTGKVSHLLLAMNAIARIVASAAIAFALPVHAQDRVQQGGPTPPAVVGGSLGLIYAVSGIVDNGAATDAGVATTIHCTNFSTTSETIQYVVRQFDGS